MTSPTANIIPMQKAVPFSESSERAAISCIVQNFRNFEEATWPDELFFHKAHRVILAAARELHEEGVPSDYHALESRLEQTGDLEAIGGHHELFAIANHMPSGDPGLARWHRETLAEHARYRRALTTVRQAEDDFRQCRGDIAGVAEALATTAATVDAQHATAKDLIKTLIADLENKEPVEAFGTGIPRLDEITTGGVKRGELLTIAAQTSGGKSILLLQLALEAMRAGKKVAVYSLEMSETQVIGRIVSAMMGVNVALLRMGGCNGELMNKFRAATAELKGWHLNVTSQLTDLEAIDGSVRGLAAKGEVDLVLVDYLQLVHLRTLGSNETREQHVSEITKRLKTMALHLNVAVATASQLNDEGKLRESRAIGHHSDHVWRILQGDEPVIVIDKNREGERGGIVPVYMRGATAEFLPRVDEPKTKSNK